MTKYFLTAEKAEYAEMQAKLKAFTDGEAALKAVRQIYNVLGPVVPSCMECQGCHTEWQAALDEIKELVK